MGYTLGVDLGTTWTGAAIAQDGRVAPCTIESHQTLVPSLVHVDDAGTWSFGIAARRRSESDPDGLARAFKRSFGDPVPVILSGRPVPGGELMGRLLAWVVERVTEQEDDAPELVVLSHPAHWSSDQKAMLRGAAKDHVPDVEVGLITEPEAIAVHYAAERTPPEGLLAIYDFGGGTFDATVLSSTDSGFAIVGEPVGRDRVGGIDLDDLIVGWALEQLGPDTVGRLDRSDPVVSRALRRLRDDAVEAKETLSTEAQATISVGLPTVRQELRLVRADFERLARPLIDETIAAVGEACASAGAEAGDLQLILLAGGSSRVPLVAEMIAGELGVETSTAVHPKLAVALGAGGSTLPVNKPAPTPPPNHTETVGSPSDELAVPPPVDLTTAPSTPPPVPPTPPVAASGSRRGLVMAGVGIVALLAAVWFAFLRDSGESTAGPTSAATPDTIVATTAPTTTTAQVPLTSGAVNTALVDAQTMYQSGSGALMDFVTQALPTTRVDDSNFLVGDCQTKLIEIQGNPAIGRDFAELRDHIAQFPEGVPDGYVDPAGGTTGFQDRFDLFATQVWDGYNACLSERTVNEVDAVIGAWSGALAFMCATEMFDGIPLDPTEVRGATVACATTPLTETELCQALAAPLLEQFSAGLTDPTTLADAPAACAEALAPLGA